MPMYLLDILPSGALKPCGSNSMATGHVRVEEGMTKLPDCQTTGSMLYPLRRAALAMHQLDEPHGMEPPTNPRTGVMIGSSNVVEEGVVESSKF